MKAFFILLTIKVLVLIALIYNLLRFHFIYLEFIRGNASSNLLTVKTNKILLNNTFIKKELLQELDSNKLWLNLPFENFTLPYPLKNPTYKIIPSPQNGGRKIFANVDYITKDEGHVLRFRSGKTYPFNITLPQDYIFEFKVVEDFILSIDPIIIWRDLYIRNLTQYNPSKIHYLKNIITTKGQNILNLAYNLYIYRLRERLFSSYTNIFYVNPFHFYVKETSNQADMAIEGHIYHKGLFYIYKIFPNYSSIESKLLISRIIQKINLVFSEHTYLASKTYLLYHEQKYQVKTDFSGASLLYFSWSQDKENYKYLREMIQNTEKIKKNLKYVFPLYQFSKERFNNTFSHKEKSSLQETNENLENKDTAPETIPKEKKKRQVIEN